jgi:hypothetical protein
VFCQSMENLMTINSTKKIVKKTENDRLRIRYAFLLSIFGLALAAGLAFFLVWWSGARVNNSSEVVAIIGVVTSLTGALVGTFIGLQIGEAGAEHERRSRLMAEESRHNAEELSQCALAQLHPDIAQDVLEAHRMRVSNSGATA